jgi:hypothetical protein
MGVFEIPDLVNPISDILHRIRQLEQRAGVSLPSQLTDPPTTKLKNSAGHLRSFMAQKPDKWDNIFRIDHLEQLLTYFW